MVRAAEETVGERAVVFFVGGQESEHKRGRICFAVSKSIFGFLA
jgi:hypothetical protein